MWLQRVSGGWGTSWKQRTQNRSRRALPQQDEAGTGDEREEGYTEEEEGYDAGESCRSYREFEAGNGSAAMAWEVKATELYNCMSRSLDFTDEGKKVGRSVIIA
jgi:hypothetical protein